MNEVIVMILVFAAGVILGIIFFGGLWFTVKKAVNAKMPGLWILSSFILRIGITLLGFYMVGGDNWRHLLVCLIGFIVARFAVLYFTKAFDRKKMNLTQKELHGTQS